jgi:hypothetical protein
LPPADWPQGPALPLSVKITPQWINLKPQPQRFTGRLPWGLPRKTLQLIPSAHVPLCRPFLFLSPLSSLSLPDTSHALSAHPNASAGAPARRLHRAAVHSDVLRSAQGASAQ